MTDRTSMSDVLHNQYFRFNFKIRDDKTKRKYKYAINHLGRFLGTTPTLEDLTDDNIAGMMTDMLRRNLAIRTVNDARSRIHAFWTWLAKKGKVRLWPTTPKLDEPEPDPVAWREHEMFKLVQTASEYRGSMMGMKLADWWVALFAVVWDTGCRTMELLSLRWEWLDMETGVMRVPAVARKGKRKNATYHLKPATIELLKRLRPLVPMGVIFRCGKNESSFYHRYNRLLEKAGLPTGRRNGIQKMRRSFATWIRVKGGNSQQALGHSSAATTDKFYIDKSLTETSQNLVLGSITSIVRLENVLVDRLA